MALIERLLSSDAGVSAEEQAAILKKCRTKPRRVTVTAREAMKMLGISRPTLRAYVKQGMLTQVNMSPRKVRFYQDEVEQLADYGAAAK